MGEITYDKEDLIYFAGLFDGEGTITLMKREGNQNRTPMMELSSTTYELVIFCKSLFGGKIYNKKTYKEHHTKCFTWYMKNGNIFDIMEAIYPYIKEPKKSARIKHILDNYKNVTVRNGKYTEDSLLKKIKFEEDFFNIGRLTLNKINL